MLAALLVACATLRGEAPEPTPSPLEEPPVAEIPEAGEEAPTPPRSTPTRHAVARLEPRSGSTVVGTVTLVARSEEGREAAPVSVIVEIEGAPPGDHGIHIHERGDCSAPDASSAGGHFNPEGTPHGAPGSTEKHPGDLGNVRVGPDGRGHAEILVDSITLTQGVRSVEGLAVIVHEHPDDYSQPSGNAGGRLACGVIVTEFASR